MQVGNATINPETINGKRWNRPVKQKGHIKSANRDPNGKVGEHTRTAIYVVKGERVEKTHWVGSYKGESKAIKGVISCLLRGQQLTKKQVHKVLLR